MVTGREPILIWGAGAIGGTLGAYWARAGVPVLLVDVVGGARRGVPHHGAAKSQARSKMFKVVSRPSTPDEVDGLVPAHRARREGARHRAGAASS